MRLIRLVSSVLILLGLAPSARAESLDRTHDGFHLQIALGVGRYKSSGSDALGPYNEITETYAGTTFPVSLFMGGVLFNHLAIGGGMSVDYSSSPTLSRSSNGFNMGEDKFDQTTLSCLGVYGDYYLNASGDGPHFQLLLGVGGIDTYTVNTSSPSGYLATLGVGYDWWIADQLSIGVLGRLVLGTLSLHGTSYSTSEPSIVGALTWN